MKLGKCKASNFASYAQLTLDFTDAGLALVHGATGAGKSTLQDMPCWALFGVTSKNGAVDEVRSWHTPNQPTSVYQTVHLHDGAITVTRVRGRTGENDLYWTEGEESNEKRRGKDLKDTQALLEKRLGISADLYLTAAYASEFSDSGSFFVSNTKLRRAVLERVANLDTPVRLMERTSAARKVLKDRIAELTKDVESSESKIKTNEEHLRELELTGAGWIERVSRDIEAAKTKAENFTSEVYVRVQTLTSSRNQFESKRIQTLHDTVMKLEEVQGALKKEAELDAAERELKQEWARLQEDKCPRCGSFSNSAERERLTGKKNALERLRERQAASLEKFKELKRQLEDTQNMVNPYVQLIAEATSAQNPYLTNIELLEASENPYTRATLSVKRNLSNLRDLVREGRIALADAEGRLSSVSRLYDLSFTLRGELLQAAVSQTQAETNRLLSSYFDSEIRVDFALDEDDLQVGINKSGYDCTYSQLSKGQRQLLRLCFMTAMMRIAGNRSSTYPENVFFDEALDGMDPDLKVKAFGLFEELAQNHESVLVIEHSSEFKELFTTKIHVTLVGDTSIVEVSGG